VVLRILVGREVASVPVESALVVLRLQDDLLQRHLSHHTSFRYFGVEDRKSYSRWLRDELVLEQLELTLVSSSRVSECGCRGFGAELQLLL